MGFRIHSAFPGLITLLLVLLGAACSSSPRPAAVDITPTESTAESIDGLLAAARQRSGRAAAALSIQAMEAMLREEFFDRARDEADRIIRPGSLPGDLPLRYAMIRARLALESRQPEAALRWLGGALTVSADPRSNLGREYYSLRGRLHAQNGQHAQAVNAYLEIADPSISGRNTSLFDDIWLALSRLGDGELDTLAARADSYELRGWVELARVYRADQFSMRSQLDAIAQWRRNWARHPASNRLPGALTELQQIWDDRPSHIALILPLQEPAGNAIQEGFLSAYYQALSISREVPRISVYDSSGVARIHSLYNEAVDSGAEMIVGPLNKQLVNQLQELAELPVPTLALNYTDNQEPQPANLFQFGLAPEDEIRQAAQLAWDAGYRNAAVLTPRSEDYLRLQNAFIEVWAGLGGQLVSRTTFSGDSEYADVIKSLMAIDSSESRAERLLALLPRRNMEFIPRRRNDIEFIFLIANPRQGRQINPTLAFYFAEDIPVYAMPSINDGLDNPSENRDLDGIVFTDAPWVLDSADPLKQEISASLRQARGPLQRLRALGIDSFRLYSRLQQLTGKKVLRLAGTTGELSMAANGRIHRHLAVARFVDGLAVSFGAGATESDD